MDYPEYTEPEALPDMRPLLLAPRDFSKEVPVEIALEKGPNIQPLPEFEPLPDQLSGPVLLKAGDNVSTDEILPAGTEILPLRSNIPAISHYTFSRIDETFYQRAKDLGGDSFVIGGENYGQGSSREHAAIAPRYLGVRAVIAVSMARIHRRNLINFGVVPLLFKQPEDLARLGQGDELVFTALPEQLQNGDVVSVQLADGKSLELRHNLSGEEVATVIAGGLINKVRTEKLGN